MKAMADAPLAQTFSSPQRMPLNLPLRCRFGRMRGVANDVAPSSGFEVEATGFEHPSSMHYLTKSSTQAARNADSHQPFQ